VSGGNSLTTVALFDHRSFSEGGSEGGGEGGGEDGLPHSSIFKLLR